MSTPVWKRWPRPRARRAARRRCRSRRCRRSRPCVLVGETAGSRRRGRRWPAAEAEGAAVGDGALAVRPAVDHRRRHAADDRVTLRVAGDRSADDANDSAHVRIKNRIRGEAGRDARKPHLVTLLASPLPLPRAARPPATIPLASASDPVSSSVPMTDPKRILVVEDDAQAAALIRRGLAAESGVALELLTGSLAEARAAIDRAPPDVVIAALKLPDGRGTDLIPGFELVAMYPVVVMAATGDETTAVEAMKAGALDYVVKSEATLLGMAQVVRRALREWVHLVERRRAEQLLIESEQRYRLLYDDNPSMFFTVDAHGTLLQVNRLRRRALGYGRSNWWARASPTLHPDERSRTGAAQRPGLFRRARVTCTVGRCAGLRRDGCTLWVRETARTVVDATGRTGRCSGCARTSPRRAAFRRSCPGKASHDALTGLVNRREFERRLAGAAGVGDALRAHALLPGSGPVQGHQRHLWSCRRRRTAAPARRCCSRARARGTRWRGWAATSSAC